MKNPEVLAVIPARLGSSRLPGKVLLDIGGKSMVERVWLQVKQAQTISKVIIATDSQEVIDHVTAFGAEAMMTSAYHQSGTDRCAEVNVVHTADYIINIQGDEPFIEPSQIDSLIEGMIEKNADLATLYKKIERAEDLFSSAVVKLCKTENGRVLYFSRHPIPYIRSSGQEHWMETHVFYKHIGIYAYTSDVLQSISKLSVSSLEKAESLEQLRWLENGRSIIGIETSFQNFGIDTAEDLEKARNHVRRSH